MQTNSPLFQMLKPEIISPAPAPLASKVRYVTRHSAKIPHVPMGDYVYHQIRYVAVIYLH